MRRRPTSPARLAWNSLIRLWSASCSTAPAKTRRHTLAITTRLTRRTGRSPRGKSDPALPSLLPATGTGTARGGSHAHLVVVCSWDNLAEPGKLVAAVERGRRVPEDPGGHRDGPAVFALAGSIRHGKSGCRLGSDFSSAAGAGFRVVGPVGRRVRVSAFSAQQRIAACRSYHPDLHAVLVASGLWLVGAAVLLPRASLCAGHRRSRAAPAQRLAPARQPGHRSCGMDRQP